jgi:hypothetical protein
MSSIKVYSDDPSNDAYQHDFLAFRPMMEIASDTYSLIVTRNPRTDSSLSDEQVRCLKDTVRAELESTSTTSIASKMCRSWPNLFLGVVNQTTNDGVYEEFDELAHEIAGRVMSDGSLKNIPYEVMTPEYNHHGKLGLSIRVSRKARSLVSVGHPSPSPWSMNSFASHVCKLSLDYERLTLFVYQNHSKRKWSVIGSSRQ